MRRRHLDLGRYASLQAALLLAFCVWTLVPLFVLLAGHGVYNGGYGIDVPDVMQYMGFIRDSGQHFLISNQFNVAADPHLFLDPVFAISGLLWRAGTSIQAAQLFWVPIAAVALVFTFAAYARRLLGESRVVVAVAMVLALFFLTPATALTDWLHASSTVRFGTQVVGLEMFAGAYSWGGGPALSIALMPVFLLAVERLLDPARRAVRRSPRWYAVWAGLAGALTMWLHPWQGITLLVIVAVLALWGRLERRYLVLALPVALTTAPLAYFFALSRTHSAWMVVSRPNQYPHFGWWLALGLAPALLAVPGLAGRQLDIQERMLRIWPFAGFAVYLALDRTWFYHAFAGLSLPLAILAVKGWHRLRLPRTIAALAVLLATVPGMVWVGQQLFRTQGQHFFRPAEASALAFLNRSASPGPVLAPVMPLGQAVPAFTARQTYVGHYYWTPDYGRRVALTEELFDGRLSGPAATALVRDSKARFLASDCSRKRADLRPTLGATIMRSWHFGCATVYEVR